MPEQANRLAILSRALRQISTLAGQGTPCVLEEGLVHEVWRRLYHHPALIPRAWWKRYLSLSPTTVIVLSVSPDRARERIRTKVKHGPVNLELKDTPLDGPLWRQASLAFAAISAELAHQRRLIHLQAEYASVESICREIVGLVRPPATSPAQVKVRGIA
jgi:hypothetical protein